MNDVIVIKDSTGERISLDLPEIDNINSSKSITLEAPKPPELLALRPFKPLKLKNRLLKPVFRPPEELIKPIDSSDPDKM